MPVAFHTIAFIISLFVQTLSSPLAGSWLFFHVCGCVSLAYNKKYPPNSLPRYAILAWLLTLGLSAFIIHPVLKAAPTMWVLMAMPMLALCLRKENLKHYIWAFGSVIFLYACGIVAQMITHTQFDPAGGNRYGWPLLDANNAACVVNIALIPMIFIARKSLCWWPVAALLALALYATGSKTGIAAAAIGEAILFASEYGAQVILYSIAAGAVILTSVFFYRPDLIVMSMDAIQIRFPIWWCAWLALKDNIFIGMGLGTFGMFRIQSGSELYIPPTYAHNDLLQFSVEMGVPAAIIFCLLIVAVATSTHRGNRIPGVVAMVVFIQSMMEFQFYVPAVSLAMGLVLGSHILLTKEKGKVIMR